MIIFYLSGMLRSANFWMLPHHQWLCFPSSPTYFNITYMSGAVSIQLPVKTVLLHLGCLSPKGLYKALSPSLPNSVSWNASSKKGTFHFAFIGTLLLQHSQATVLGGGGCAHEGRSFYGNTVVLQGTAYELTVIALHMCFHITDEHSHCLVLHTKWYLNRNSHYSWSKNANMMVRYMLCSIWVHFAWMRTRWQGVFFLPQT